MTASIWLSLAALFSVITLFAHIIGGGKSIAQPVLDSALEDEPKFASYYCWHMVTIIIAYMALSFLLSAAGWVSAEIAVGPAILALLFTLWSLALCIWKQQGFFKLPQWLLFLPIAITGFLGVI